jgi:hypothetical protein
MYELESFTQGLLSVSITKSLHACMLMLGGEEVGKDRDNLVSYISSMCLPCPLGNGHHVGSQPSLSLCVFSRTCSCCWPPKVIIIVLLPSNLQALR